MSGACLRLLIVLSMLLGCHAQSSAFDPGANNYPRVQHADFGFLEPTAHYNSEVQFGACHAIATPCRRFGEADHPGPSERLMVGAFNPHQILGHESTVCGWGKGVWAAAETSHTLSARSIAAGRFRKQKMNSVWSNPVPCHSGNHGSLRGKASGTAVISHLPLKPFPGTLPPALEASSRFVDTLIDLGGGTRMYMANIYGPTHNVTHHDPWAILTSLCECAFSRAHGYRGPAVVTGDFNVNVDEIPFWSCMVKRGWIDAAAFDATRRGTHAQATSRGNARKSFILINAALVQTLVHCDVNQTYDFDTHPLLVAQFDLEIMQSTKRIWNLPANTEGCFFDDDLMQAAVDEQMVLRNDKFQNALLTSDSNEALHQINLVYEHAMQSACVDTEGHSVRRLHAFAQQRRAVTCYESRSMASCCALWRAICHAPGFPKNFQRFALEVMQLFIPSEPPDADYAKYVGDSLKLLLQTEVAEWNSQVHEHRLTALKRDFLAGGSQAFRSVKDESAPPFHAIISDKTILLAQQRWTKGGKCRLLLEPGEDPGIFDLQYPVYFQQQEAFIIEVHDSFLVLDRKVINRDQSDRLLLQKSVQSDMETLQKATAAAWGELWQRDAPNETEQDWPEAIEALTCLADIPSMEYTPLNCEEWKRHASTTKQKSARGSCAYTPRELIRMPTALVEWLLALLTAVEMGQMPWPSSIMTARVTMLGKSELLPTNPLQLRPITITSRLYRNWAKYRSMQVFKHFHDILPPEVAGTAAGVSADMLAAVVANEVEDALLDGLHRVGLTVDLIKCYNMVPRIPVVAVLRKLGVPQQYLTAVWDMFQQLDRIIEISGEMGEPVSSTTGIPEGCCFSIVSMLGLTVWTAQWIQHSHEDVECLAYADNWAFFTDCVDKLQAVLTTLQDFVTSLKMRIAPDKSWVWATHSADRKRLQHVNLQGTPIPTKLYTSDLGCDITYCKRVSKKTVRKRLTKAKRVLGRIAIKKMPKRYKCRMANQLATGITGFGSELVYFTPTELKTLRSNCCQASGRSRGGISPYLALAKPGDATDPEFGLLLRKCRFWKRFLKAFPYRREKFFDKLTAFEDGKHAGPASVFKKTLRDHGWTCLPHGTIQHELGWQVNWYYSSGTFLQKMLLKAWHHRICATVQSRKHFDLANCDIAAFPLAIKGLSDAAKTDAINYVMGKHVTNDALGHYVCVGDFSCPVCGAADSRAHRIFDCEALNTVRVRFQHVLDWLQQQPDAVTHFGILPWDEYWLDFSGCEYVPFPKVVRPIPGDHDSIHHVFTDGSASFTDCFSTTVCAGAWLCADGYTITAQGGSVLPGNDHSAYRGEVWAVVLVLQQYHRVIIYTDCAAVLTVCQHLLSARVTGSLPRFGEHEDLWSLVWEMILTREPGCIQLCKVKAHQDLTSVHDPHLHWMAYMNARVDTLAKDLVKQYCTGNIRALQQHNKALQYNRKMLHQFFDMWNCMNHEAMEVVKQRAAPRTGAMPVFSVDVDLQNLSDLQCNVSDADIRSCLYGSTFIQRVIAYFNGLQWDFSKPAVSLLELYADFSIFTGSLTPVLLTRASLGLTAGPKVYRLKDDNIVADMTFCDLQNQSRVWQRTIKWLLQHWIACPWTTLTKTHSLGRLGYTVEQNGLMGRPNFRSGSTVYTRLWQYFHTDVGIRRAMNRKWTVSHVASSGGA
eukprot:Skav235415  [mRNA]  locus=scaffold924:108827:114000:- [translate_table: standard]